LSGTRHTGDYFDSMNLFEEVVEEACLAVHGKTILNTRALKLISSVPGNGFKLTDAIKELTGLDVLNMQKD